MLGSIISAKRVTMKFANPRGYSHLYKSLWGVIRGGSERLRSNTPP